MTAQHRTSLSVCDRWLSAEHRAALNRLTEGRLSAEDWALLRPWPHSSLPAEDWTALRSLRWTMTEDGTAAETRHAHFKAISW